MRNLPGIAKKWLIFFVISSVLIGITLDFVFGTKIDYWIHDSAVVYQSRNQWRYAAIVVLDNDIPIQVGRKQALPLFARAAEKAIEAGAKGIFLDARVPKEIEGIMPYALCYETQGKVRWSKPECLSLASNQCELRESSAGHAPLKMKNKVFPFFKMAPYLDDGGNLPDFLLFGWGAENSIPAGGLVAKDRLVRRNSTINRWLDLSEDHAVVQLAKFINAQHVNISLKNDAKEVCDQNRSCRRIRLSQPRYDIEFSTHRPIIPVSRVASCDDNIAKETAALLKNRIVILQLTSPSEATDMLITPMTSAWLGPHLLTPGAQFLADAVETILANDHPRAPSWFLKLAVLLLSAIISVLASAYLKQFWLWSIGLLVLLIMMGLCFLSPLQQLWPVSATMATFAAGWLQVVAIHLLIGLKKAS